MGVNHGFEQLYVDGKFVAAAGFKKLARFKEHTIDVLVGEAAKASDLPGLLERALEIGHGGVRLLDAAGKLTILSTERSCPGCGQSFEELDPRLFSYNSPHGWCPDAAVSGKSGTALRSRMEGTLFWKAN